MNEAGESGKPFDIEVKDKQTGELGSDLPRVGLSDTTTMMIARRRCEVVG